MPPPQQRNTVPPERADLLGMTLNERLYVTGLLDQFDQARKQRDRQQIVALLEKVEVRGDDAELTADEILKPWWQALLDLFRGRYGRN